MKTNHIEKKMTLQSWSSWTN